MSAGRIIASAFETDNAKIISECGKRHTHNGRRDESNRKSPETFGNIAVYEFFAYARHKHYRKRETYSAENSV